MKNSFSKYVTIGCYIIILFVVNISNVYALLIEDPGLEGTVKPDLEVKLTPKIKSLPSNIDGQSFSLKTIGSYLKNGIIVENPKLSTVPIKSTKDLKKIVNPLVDLNLDQDSRLVVGFAEASNRLGMFGDKILVSGLFQDHHLNYILVKPEFSYYHPKTKEYLGTLLVVTGNAVITARDHLSILKIEHVDEPVVVGMLVLPSRSLDFANEIKYLASKDKVNGYILSFVESNTVKSTNNSIVVLSIGERENVKVGNIFKVLNNQSELESLHKNSKPYLYRPSNPKGEILVYQVFNKLSLGIIIKSTPDIAVLDEIIST